VHEPSPRLGDVIRRFGASLRASYGETMTGAQKAVLSALGRCRTAALGGHLYRCERCGSEHPAYNSCRSRHCPSCLGHKSAEWLEARAEDLLPVPYFHVVFTVPAEIASLAWKNKKTVYEILFRAAARTLLQIARDPRHLGAQIGFLAILHTWTQTLLHHPHVHCVVPGGGLSPDGTRWIGCRETFFLPIKVLSRVFRGKFLELLDAAAEQGTLRFPDAAASLADPHAWRAFVRQMRAKEWVVYAKPPFGSPTQVLKYLARYTHRVAISDRRIVSLTDDEVTFRYRDRTHQNEIRTMKLRGVEFLRRFLLHVLPKGFVRIRHFGLLANRARKANLARCRSLLGTPTGTQPDPEATPANPDEDPRLLCPTCRVGRLRWIAVLPPGDPQRPDPVHVPLLDTS
jgi:putative transposase/transposase-like zinc-binding protein